jgi:tetratricopeptide (TPR) repeat protein
VEVLQAQVERLAESHFRRGVSLYRNKQREAAQREFLLALTYRPDHAQALEYLRVRLKPDDWVYYTTVEGDTMKVVARKAYQDEQKDFLVAAYNNLSRNAQLTPGMVLQLPIIEKDLRKPSVNVQEVLARAQGLLEQGQFEQAIAAADSILVYDPGNTTAREITNAAYYRQAKALAASNKPLEALAMFRNVDPGYRDVRESVAALQNQLKATAEAHYKKGVEFFINEKLDEAIAEWEQALRIDPEHAKAAKDLENARQLRERLRQVAR